MISGIEIRLANFSVASDCDAFLHLLDYYAKTPIGGGKPLPKTVMASIISQWSKHVGSFTLLAFAGETPAGLANCVTSFSTFLAMPRINVHDLVVQAAFEGQGLGRALIDEVIAESKERGAGQVTLEVRADNVRARGLYQRMGFQGLETSETANTTFFGVKAIL